MKQLGLFVLFVLVATALGLAQDQSLSAGTVTGGSQAATAVVNPEAQSESIRILTPVAGQTLAANFVVLRFELARPSLSGEPTFMVQLDGADPINTTSTDYTFTGLQPGIHSVRVTLVNANNVPVQGGTAAVQFKVPVIAQPARSDGSHGAKVNPSRTVAGAFPAAPIPPELRSDGDVNLPLAGSPLPLLSLIGFGLLLGGAAQTMRSRKQ